MSLYDSKVEDAKNYFAKSEFIRSTDKNYRDNYDHAYLEIDNYLAINQKLQAKHPKLQHEDDRVEFQ